MSEAKRDAILLQIAYDTLHVATLETRRSDRLDFYALHVSNVRTALELAYEAGQRNSEGGRS